MIPMAQNSIEIVCGLCACHFSSLDLSEDDIMCRICGHSLDDDHAAGPDAESEQETAAAI